MRSAEELIERALEGHMPSVARLISRLERQGADGDAILNRLHAEGGKAHVIGITGAAGSGKSHARQRARRASCARATRPSASSPSTRAARSPAARSSATASG